MNSRDQRKAISQEHTFAFDIIDRATLVQTLQQQSANVSSVLRTKRVDATVVRIKLRWEDFTTLTRQRTLAEPTDDERLLQQAALLLFEQTWDGKRPVRLIGVGVGGLQSLRQLRLWDDNEPLRALGM